MAVSLYPLNLLLEHGSIFAAQDFRHQQDSFLSHPFLEDSLDVLYRTIGCLRNIQAILLWGKHKVVKSLYRLSYLFVTHVCFYLYRPQAQADAAGDGDSPDVKADFNSRNDAALHELATDTEVPVADL